MNKPFAHLSVAIAGGLALTFAALGADYWLDKRAERFLENHLSRTTGVVAEASRVDVRLFQQQVNVQDLRFENVENFSSVYLMQISKAELHTASLYNYPTIIELITLDDIAINLDVKVDINLLQPDRMLQINLQEVLDKLDANQNIQRSQTSISMVAIATESSSRNVDFTIDELKLSNIIINISLSVPLQQNSITQQIAVDQIVLHDLNNLNLGQKITEQLQNIVWQDIERWLKSEGLSGLSLLLEKQLLDSI